MKLRSPKFSFDQVPNHWFAGNSLQTYLGNSFHATIPSGERFIIRAAARLKDKLPGGEQATLRIFLGQEGQHAAAHDGFSRVLARQGYEPARLAKAHDRAYARLERWLPPIFRLSIAAGVEHYTALLGDDALVRQNELGDMPSDVKAILLWHAAEEVEHRSVIFDALRALNPSYLLRAAGFAAASAILASSTAVSLAHFYRRDPEKSRARLAREALRAFRAFPFAKIGFLALEYLKPGFHPSQRGETARAVEFLTAIETRA